MRNVVIAGIGMTRFGKFADTGLRPLAEDAVSAALTDAGVEPSAIGMVAFGNALAGLITGQESIRGEVTLRNLGFPGTPIVNVDNACASGSTAFHLAWLAVASEQCDAALAVGAEKLTHPNKMVSFKAMESAVDLDEIHDLKLRIGAESGGSATRSMFMDLYADMTRAYMERSGSTVEDFAQVAVKNHHAGALNPKAQFRNEVTIDQVMESRMVADPLRLMMCSAIGDGAAALVLMSEGEARRRGVRPVLVRASVLVTGSGDSGLLPAAIRAAQRAYETSGIGPGDVDVVELHDATAPAELMLYEDLALCAPGGGPGLLRSGATAIGGRMPVNPSGGLLSKGHPVGASGCAQLVELTEQLRGQAGPRQREAARVALAENGGGYIGNDVAAACVTVLSR